MYQPDIAVDYGAWCPDTLEEIAVDLVDTHEVSAWGMYPVAVLQGSSVVCNLAEQCWDRNLEVNDHFHTSVLGSNSHTPDSYY